MSEWIDVPVDQVSVGDEVRLDGFGSQGSEYRGDGFHPVHTVGVSRINVGRSLETFRRSSIVACRRRKPEPQPKPGDWQCFDWDGFTKNPVECLSTHHQKHEGRKVYRASGGWSADTRTVDRRKK